MGLIKKIVKAAKQEPDMYGRPVPEDETPEQRKEREAQTALNSANAAGSINISNS